MHCPKRSQIIVGDGDEPVISGSHLVRPRRHAQNDGLVHAGRRHVRLDAGDGVGGNRRKAQVGLHIPCHRISDTVGPDVSVNVNAHR